MSLYIMTNKFPTVLKINEYAKRIERNIDFFEQINSHYNIEIRETQKSLYTKEIINILSKKSIKYQKKIKKEIIYLLKNKKISLYHSDKYVKITESYNYLINNEFNSSENFICKIHFLRTCETLRFDFFTKSIFDKHEIIFAEIMSELELEFKKELELSYKKLHELELYLENFKIRHII